MNAPARLQVLDGYRVVELAAWVAGPAAGGVLADWGAEVIKVEPPSGDPQRRIFGALGIDVATAPPFELDNRGKRSVVLDLQTVAGREAMDRLFATADVFVTNLRTDALGRLGLDPASVSGAHPRLVYASITGYGSAGPDAWRPGYDVGAFWARSSMAASLVPPGDLPPGIRSGMGDHVTGMTLVAGILAALLERERTGRGGVVATSLLRTGIYCMGWDIGIYLRFGKLQRTRPRQRQPAPLVNSYRAGDGRGFWLIGLEQDRHWPGLVAAIERPDLATDERFATAKARATHCESLVAALDETFAAPSARGVDGPVRRPRRVVGADQHGARARGGPAGRGGGRFRRHADGPRGGALPGGGHARGLRRRGADRGGRAPPGRPHP